MELSKLTLLLVTILIGSQSYDLCPGDKPVVTFVNDGMCNCKVSISENETLEVQSGQKLSLSLFNGSYDFKSNCSSDAFLNDQKSTLEQIA